MRYRVDLLKFLFCFLVHKLLNRGWGGGAHCLFYRKLKFSRGEEGGGLQFFQRGSYNCLFLWKPLPLVIFKAARGLDPVLSRSLWNCQWVTRIYHEGRIEKSFRRIAVCHQEACRVMTNSDPEGQIFLSYPHTNNGFFFLLTTIFFFFFFFCLFILK